MENDLIRIKVVGATHRLVLLHGWGADVNDLIPLGQELTKGILERKIELLALFQELILNLFVVSLY